MVKALLFGALFICALSVSDLEAADSKSYGRPEELRGLTKVFVDAGGELDLRGVMAQAIAKRLPEVTIVAESDDAEIVLTFSYSRDSAKADSFDGRLLATRTNGEKVRYIASYRHDESELDDLAKRSCFSSSSSTSRSTASRSRWSGSPQGISLNRRPRTSARW